MKEGENVIGEDSVEVGSIKRGNREYSVVHVGRSKTTWRDRVAGLSLGLIVTGLVASDSVRPETPDENSIINLPDISEILDSEIVGSFPIVPIENGSELDRVAEFHQDRSKDGLTDVETRDRVLDSYTQQRDGFINFARYELFTDGSLDAISQVKQERYESVIFGINILQSYLGRADIRINAQQGLVEIPESRPFSLGNTTDLVILDQIIQYELKDFKEKPADKGERTDDILWLANNRDLDIEVKEDAFAFLQSEGMLNLSRILQKMDSLGYVMPEEIDYVQQFGHDTAIGKYISSQNRILITGDEGSGTSVHEVGHNQADENEAFSQGAYDFKITGVEDAITARGMVTGLSQFTEEYGNTNNKEDYATVFEWYFTRGKEFRDKIKAEFLAQSPEYEFLKRKYEFMRELFNGEEYLYNGMPFRPEIGDVFSISKPNSLQNGIILRSSPDFNKDPLDGENELVVVLNNERVRIINTSQEEMNLQTGLMTKMYLVMKENGETGW